MSKTEDIASSLALKIEQGVWAVDEALPSFAKLTEIYDVSRVSIMNAMKILEARGLVRRVHGKGCFVQSTKAFSSLQGGKSSLPSSLGGKSSLPSSLGGNSSLRSERASKGLPSQDGGNSRDLHFGLSYPIHAMNRALIHRLEDEVMSWGGLVTSYNISSDRQDLASEAKFLERCMLHNIRGLVLFASPLDGTNRALFQALEAEGVRLVHVSPYRESLRGETYYLPEFRQLGRDLVHRAIEKGCDRLLSMPSLGRGSVHLSMILEGVYGECMRRGLPLETCPHPLCRDGVLESGDLPQWGEANGEALNWVKSKMDEASVFLLHHFYCEAWAMSHSFGHELPEGCSLSFPERSDMGVCGVPYVDEPYADILLEAMRLLREVSPSQWRPHTRWFKAGIVEP